MLEADGVVVGNRVVLFHYNLPYGDILSAVAEPLRNAVMAFT